MRKFISYEIITNKKSENGLFSIVSFIFLLFILSKKTSAMFYFEQEDSTNLNDREKSSLWHYTEGMDGLTRIKRHVDNEYNVNLVDDRKRSLLQRAARTGGEQGESIVRLLVNKGADISHLDSDGGTAIYMATTKGHYKIVEFLINKLKDDDKFKDLEYLINKTYINKKDGIEYTLLHIASERGFDEIIKFLCSNGAIVDQLDGFGRTALHVASYKGHGIVVRTLVDFGASVFKKSTSGFMARHYAIYRQLENPLIYSNIVEYLKYKEIILRIIERERVQECYEEKIITITSDESLKVFYDSFISRMTSTFIAYKLLEADLIERSRSFFCISNVIDMGGDLLSVPGTAIVSNIAASIEDNIEKPLIEYLATCFKNIEEAEQCINEASRELTLTYQEKIKKLTPKGARMLAKCAVDRFIKYTRFNFKMRYNSLININERSFFDYVQQAITYSNSSLSGYSHSDVKIETRKGEVWTDKFIFEIERDESRWYLYCFRGCFRCFY